MIRTVGELREQLAPFPDYRPLVVEVTIGGDLVTDDVDLLELEEGGTSEGTYVRLRHAPDDYDVRNLIDDGLAYREDLEVARYRVVTRRPDLWRILDRRTGMVDVVAFGEAGGWAALTIAEHAAEGLEDSALRRLRRRIEREEAEQLERHCHADGAGPCLAADCPIAGQRPRACPGAEGPQHPAQRRA